MSNQNSQQNILSETFGKQSRWVNHKNKEPYMPSGERASTKNSNTWSSYDEVIVASPNVGIVFTPDKLLLGIDIDHCIENNQIVHEQKDAINQFIQEANTYTEISPSGTGLRLYLLMTSPLELTAHKCAPFEVYNTGRYFTVTNNPLGDAKQVRTVTPEEAPALLSIIKYPWGKVEVTKVEQPSKNTVLFSDSELLEKMFSASNGPKAKVLYHGDISAYGGDDSSADMAICGYLAYWTGCNAEQMDRMWLASPLGARSKTQERKDYRDVTIEAAINGNDGVYSQVKKTEDTKGVVRNTGMKLTSWGEFSGKVFPEAQWRIKDLIPMEGFVILSAISGEKKTWVSLEMAKCIAQGINFLGTDLFKTEQAKILYVDQENPERDIVRRGKQLEITGSGNFFLYRPDSLNLNDERVADEFRKLIFDNGIKVVFIDTFRAVAGGLKEDKAEDVRMFFNRFKIFKDTGVVVIWLDHRRKPLNFEGKVPKKEQLLGSQDKTASVEILLQLSSDPESDEIRVYQAKNRLDREIPAFKILMQDTIAEDGTKYTSLMYDGKIEEDEIKKKDEAREIILELVQEGGKTTGDLCSVIGMQKKIGKKNVSAALSELVQEGTLDYTKKGHQNFYFKTETVQE